MLKTGAHFVAAVYDRPLALGIDLGYVDDLIGVARGSLGDLLAIGLLAGVLALLVTALVAMAGGFTALVRGAARRSTWWALAALVVVMAGVGWLLPGISMTSAVPEVVRQVRLAVATPALMSSP